MNNRRGRDARLQLQCGKSLSSIEIQVCALGANVLLIHVNTTCTCVSILPLSLHLPVPVQGFTPPLLVFVQSKERAKELFHELIYDGLNVEVIHADRTQAQRDNIIKSFRAGRVSRN